MMPKVLQIGVLVAVLPLSMETGCKQKEELIFGLSPDEVVAPEADRPNGRAIVEAALIAHGFSSLEHLKAGEIAFVMSTEAGPGLRHEIRDISSFQFPDRLLRSFEITSIREGMAETEKRTYLFDGQQAWVKTGDGEFEPSPVEDRITDLFPLLVLRDLITLCSSKYTLSRQDDVTINSRPLIVVSVNRDQQLLSNLYFDKDTKLLVRTSFVDRNPRSNVDGNFEIEYSDFRSYTGITLPMKVIEYVDGKVYIQKTVQRFQPMEKIDPAVFEKR